MRSLFHHRGGHYLFLTLAAAGLFFVNLGGASLWDLDEGRNATCALEMMLSGDWIVPTFNGELRDHKPALLYWLQIVCYSVGGVSEGMARVPSALAATLTLFVVYELGRRMFSKSTGLLAGVVAATSPMLIGAARFANPDALLNLFTATTMLFMWLAVQRPSWWIYALMGAATGAATLAKGPVGLALPCAVGLAFLLWDRRWRALLDWRLGWATLLFCLVALPWYILVGAVTHANFLTGFLFRHNVDRYLSTMENHGGSIAYYPLVIIVGSVPWSLFAAGAVWAMFWSCVRQPTARFQAAWERGADHAGRGGVSAYRFLTCWLLVYIVFFSVSATKLPNYILPAIVPWTLLTARFLDRWRKDSLALPTWYVTAAAVGMGMIGIGFGAGMAIASGVGELSLLRGRFYPALQPFAWLGLVPVAVAALLLFALRTNRRQLFIDGLFCAGVGLFLPLGAWATAAMNGAKAPEALAATPAAVVDIDARVVGYEIGHLPSVNFYLRRDIAHVPSLDAAAMHLAMPLPTFVVLPERYVDEFQQKHAGLAREVSRHADLYRGAKVVVLANEAAASEKMYSSRSAR